MAQRIFRSTDTDIWDDGYSNGSDGNLTISSPTTYTPDQTYLTADAVAAATAITVNSEASFAAGDIIVIWQAREASLYGYWEFNRVTSTAVNTINLAYPLTQSFDTGGGDVVMVIQLPKLGAVAINSTYTPQTWDNTAGRGIGFIYAQSITGTGTLAGGSIGYPGAPQDAGGSDGHAQTGGTYGNSSQPQQEAANLGGGGGGGRSPGGGSGGGGGGHSSGGTAGSNYAEEGGGDSGGSYGDTSLVRLTPGSGGGAGGGDQDNPSSFTGGAGGRGGGVWVLVAPEINLSSMTSVTVSGAAGTNRTPSGDNGGGGGGGAAGSILILGNNINIGTSKITAAGGSGGTGQGPGGAGSIGRVHVRYGTSLTGTVASGSYTDALDESLIPRLTGGLGRFYFM